MRRRGGLRPPRVILDLITVLVWFADRQLIASALYSESRSAGLFHLMQPHEKAADQRLAYTAASSMPL
jgi:hypothetical protein